MVIYAGGSQNIPLEWMYHRMTGQDGDATWSWSHKYEHMRQLFKDAPVFVVNDFKFIEAMVPLKYRVQALSQWHYRRYQSAWHAAPRLESVQMKPPYNGERKDHHLQVGWDQFTTIHGLVEYLLQSPTTVQWNHGFEPKHPFQLIGLTSFRIVCDSAAVFPDSIPELVDNVLSCQLYHDCVDPAEEGLPVCQHHLEVREECYEDKTLFASAFSNRVARGFLLSGDGITWRSREAIDQQTLWQLRQLHEWAESDNIKIWLIDSEFSIARNPFSFLFSELAVREFQGDTIINTRFNYDQAHRDTLLHEVKTKRLNMSPMALQQLRYTTFKRYGATLRTSGMTFTEIGETLFAKGFNPESHRVLSWYSVADMDCIGRALERDTNNNPYVVEKKPNWRIISNSDGMNILQVCSQ